MAMLPMAGLFALYTYYLSTTEILLIIVTVRNDVKREQIKN